MTKYKVHYSAARAKRGLKPYAVMEVVSDDFSQGVSQHNTKEEADAALRRLEQQNRSAKDQSAEQEVTELGKQMKKMTAKDADPWKRYGNVAEAKTAAKQLRDEGKAVKIIKHEFTNPRTGHTDTSFEVKVVDAKPTKDCTGTKDCGCGCTKDEMFTPYDSELKKHAAGAQARKVDAPKPKGRNIHIWLE